MNQELWLPVTSTVESPRYWCSEGHWWQPTYSSFLFIKYSISGHVVVPKESVVIYHTYLCVQGAGLRNAYCTVCRTQECVSYKVKDSGMHTVQGAGLRNAYRTRWRTQECVLYRVQHLGVHMAQGAGPRSSYCKGLRTQEYQLHREQNPSVCITQCKRWW